jgi:hypothetical protein
MKEEVAQARQAGQNQLDVVKLANFHFQYGALIREGLKRNWPGGTEGGDS